MQAVNSVLAAVVTGILFAPGAQAAASLGELVQQLESAIPFSAGSIGRAAAVGLTKIEVNKTVTHRVTDLKLDDGMLIAEMTWTPKSGKNPSAVNLRFPAVAARAPGCVSRADVSREYGAPVRSWNTKEGAITYTHFEFSRPANKVNVAFSDVTNCLATLTVEEKR